MLIQPRFGGAFYFALEAKQSTKTGAEAQMCIRDRIYGLVVIGLVHPGNIRRNSGAQVGDKLILGKRLGIGLYSAAFKKGMLSPHDYELMIELTTKLNTPGPMLACLAGVHAMTDVTGFGLLGHLLDCLLYTSRCV